MLCLSSSEVENYNAQINAIICLHLHLQFKIESPKLVRLSSSKIRVGVSDGCEPFIQSTHFQAIVSKTHCYSHAIREHAYKRNSSKCNPYVHPLSLVQGLPIRFVQQTDQWSKFIIGITMTVSSGRTKWRWGGDGHHEIADQCGINGT
jgi:hypothetical protein